MIHRLTHSQATYEMPSTFGAHLDLRFSRLGDNNKVNLLVAKAFFDSFFLFSQEIGDLLSVGWPNLTTLVCVNKLFLETVYRICRGVGLNGVLYGRLRVCIALDARGVTFILAFVNQALNAIPVTAVTVETAGDAL